MLLFQTFSRTLTLVLASLLVATSLAPTVIAQPNDGGTGGENSGDMTPPEYVVDWERKVDVHAGLTPLDTGLLGDSIDPHSGSISFQNTDVSLPGNSALQVAISRRLTSGRLFHHSVNAEFGDWELVVPRISVITHRDSNWRTNNGSRCTNPESALNTVQTPITAEIPQGNGGGYVTILTNTVDGDYSDGYKIDLPGHGKLPLLVNRGQVQLQQNKGSQYITTSGVSVICLSSAIGGGEGFEATTPDGTVYTFDRFIEHRYTDMEYTGYPELHDSFKRYVSMVVATRVTDVHGNTVDYNYNSVGRLTSIQANDGRRIDLNYLSPSDSRISKVTANGRDWHYTYEQDLVHLDYWEGHNVGFSLRTLRSVTQPDGRSWTYDLIQMNAPAPAADSCHSSGWTMSVKHPYGTNGEFRIVPRLHRVSFNKPSYKKRDIPPGYCPYFRIEGSNLNNYGSPVPTVPDPRPQIEYLAPIYVLSVESKSLTNINIPNMVWRYQYEVDWGGIGSSADDRTNWTKITHPDGTIHEYHHVWGTEYVNPGKLLRKSIIDTAGNVLRRETYTYQDEGNHGTGTVCCAKYSFREALTSRQVSSTIRQDGDSYSIQTAYNSDLDSLSYSFGKPVQTRRYSNLSTTHRVTDYTYEHNKAKWVLGLPKQITVNGRNVASYTYDDLGRKTHEYQYGQLVGRYSYKTSPGEKGLIDTYYDALNRQTYLSHYKRGKPQQVRRPDGVTIHKSVDDNGWVTSSTDAKGNVTAYAHDIMGRLTQIDPQYGSWNSTNIAYNFPASGGAVQTVNQGSASTIINYDAFLRPQTVTQQSDIWSSTVTTGYDALGRQIFVSLPSSDVGTHTAYDALGRVTDTWRGHQHVTALSGDHHIHTDYLSGHAVLQTRPDGTSVTQHFSGYDGPGGNVLLEIQEQGRLTRIDRDDFDRPTRLQQFDQLGGTAWSVTQTMLYDDRGRLCAHYVPEHGESRYLYDAAGQLLSSIKGQSSSFNWATASSSACASTRSQMSDPGAQDRIIDFGYDTIGRLIWQDLPPGQTDTLNSYDAAGHLLSSKRGTLTANRTMPAPHNMLSRTYDGLGNILTDTQSIMGAPIDFTSTYTYDDNGHRNSHTYPMGNLYRWTNDGFGHQRDLRQGTYAYAANIQYYPDGSSQSFTMGNQLISWRGIDAYGRTTALHAAAYGASAQDYILRLDYAYDSMDRISSISDSAAIVPGETKTHELSHVSYDTLGQLSRADGWWGLGTFTHDGLGNMMSRDLGERSFSYTYDAENRLQAYTDPHLSLTGRDDLANTGWYLGGSSSHWILVSGQSIDNIWGEHEYSAYLNPVGQLEVSKDGITIWRSPSPAGDPTHTYHMATLAGGNLVIYDTDDNHRVMWQTQTNGQGQVFLAMQLDGHLVLYKGSGPSDIQGAIWWTGTYSGLNEDTSGRRDLTYDASGNITYLDGKVMSYDAANRLTSISGENTASYSYNGDGKRVRAVQDGRETFFVYDDRGRLILSYKASDGEAVERLYLEDGTPLAKWTGTALTYLHTNHLGTPIRGTHGLGDPDGDPNTGPTDRPGDIVFDDFRSPFGLLPDPGWGGAVVASGYSSTTGTGPNCGVTGFTTHVRDCETNLTYMQARYYDPVMGRFLSIDPVTFMQTGDPRYFNRYAYAANDPVNMIDPDGQAFGVASKVVKVAIKGGDIGSVLAGGIADAKTLTGRNVSLGRRLAAGASLATEIFSPVSARDAKAITAGASKALSAKKVNGNCKSCTKPQHRYEISDQTGDVKKTGISGQPLNQNGTSRRANSQVNKMNNAGDGNTYSATVQETGIPGRAAALNSEKAATSQLKAAGNSLSEQKRPKH